MTEAENTYVKPFEEWACIRGDEPFALPNTPRQVGYKTRSWYDRDIDQIIYSSVFRKLQYKSQLLPPSHPRIRSRLVHTLEVVRIAREISARLGLSTKLTEAIAYGHDLANSPFGSVGNNALKRRTSTNKQVPYIHEDAGALMAQTLSSRKISDDGSDFLNKATHAIKSNKGFWKWPNFDYEIYVAEYQINSKMCYFDFPITNEVLDGIRNHNKPEVNDDGSYSSLGDTLEAQVVWAADNFAYISQDLDDLMYVELLKEPELRSCCADKSWKSEGRLYWDDVNSVLSDNLDLKGLLSPRSGIRVGTMIDRFVTYNIQTLKNGKMENSRFSKILNKPNMPRLKIDKQFWELIGLIWRDVIEPKYKNKYIKVSNKEQINKIHNLFDILEEKTLIKNNKTIYKFFELLDDARFSKFGQKWKISYFICHLSWYEVENIIKHFQQQDHEFLLEVVNKNFI